MDTSAEREAKPNSRTHWKRWLWLLSIPALVIAAPALLMAVFIAYRAGSVLTTRPYLWETASGDQNVEDLAGNYLLTKDVDAGAGLTPDQMKDVRVVLTSDHLASVKLVPDMDAWGDLQKCTWNGDGKWMVFNNQLSIQIEQAANSAGESCGRDDVNYGLEILKHHRLWMVVGDPDEGRGLIFTRENTN
jgi:hypothetical protein